MNALTATTTFCPSSFQLKFALSGRRSSLGFARTRHPELDRRRVNFVPVRSSSGVNGSGVEQRTSGNSTWIGGNSSTNDFSGWANADGDNILVIQNASNRFVLSGILGAGAAGVLLVAGLTFAALSLGKRNTSRVKEQMEPVTTEQEKALSSDEFKEQFEKDKSEEKFGMLESGSGESNKLKNPDLSFNKDDGEANESGAGDDTGMRQLSEDGDLANTRSSVSVAQSESAINYSMGSPKVTDTSSLSDITDGSVDVPNIQSDNQSVAAEDPNDTAAEKLGDISEASLFDAKSENLNTDHPNGVSDSNVLRNSNLSQDSSSVEPSAVNISLIETDAVIESNTIQEVFMESERVLSTSDAEPIKEMMAGDVGPSNFADLSVDKNDKSAVRENLSGSIGAALVPEVAYQSAFNDINVGRSFFDSTNPGNFFTSAGIPAPSLVSAALQAPQGKVLVPAAVDQLQSQALSALQVLKVIEDDVQPGDLCTRREYARWLVLASSALSRNTTSKVYPAMYIENVSELAFDDITPEDPDFPSVQGLAEAGLIASKLSRRDMQLHGSEDQSSLFFSPESPLSRQDLVSWKMALDKRQLPVVDRKTLQQLSGFIDIDKIDPDAWPALAADLAAGEQGIVTLAFGYTRLFQPEKPVTKAQAAIALSTGDASAMVSEELARIEAESMAEKAVAAHNALVSQAEKELSASYEEQLSLEREKIDAVQRLAEEARKEVEKLRAEREEENLSLMKERAAVDSEMEILSRLRREVEEQLQTLMSDKLEISYVKERLNKLRRDAETENQEITRLQYELEVEQKALSMARAWAEDEAKRAREQAKTLEEARDRWERQGLKVVVDDDLREEEAEAEVTWLAAGKQFSVEETIDRSEGLLDKLKAMASEVSGKCKVTINKIIEMIVLFISNLKKKAIELKDASKSTFQNSLQGVRHSSSEFTSSAKEGAKRVAGDWKEGVERLSQKFKT